MDEDFKISTFSPEGNPNVCIYLKKNEKYVDSPEILEQLKRFLTDYFGNRFYYSSVKTDRGEKLMFWMNVRNGELPPTDAELTEASSVFTTKSRDSSLAEEDAPIKKFTEARKEEYSDLLQKSELIQKQNILTLDTFFPKPTIKDTSTTEEDTLPKKRMIPTYHENVIKLATELKLPHPSMLERIIFETIDASVKQKVHSFLGYHLRGGIDEHD